METSNGLRVKERSSQESGKVSDQTGPATRQQRKHSLALLLSQLPLVTPDSSQVDHQNRTDEYLGDTDLTANRQFPGLASKGMSHATDGAFDRCPPVVAPSSYLGSPLAQLGYLHLASAQAQHPRRPAFQGLGRTLVTQRTSLTEHLVEVDQKAARFATDSDLCPLPTRTAHSKRHASLVCFPAEHLQSQSIRRGTTATNMVGICST